MKKLYILVGNYFTGKSLYAKQLEIHRNCIILNKLNYTKKYKDISESKVYKKLIKDIITSFDCGFNVVIDDINIDYKSRKYIIDGVKNIIKNLDIIAVVFNKSPEFDFSIDKCNLIFETAKKFKFPQKFEGFTDIKFAYPHQDIGNNYIMEAETFDQKSKYHDFTLAEHMRKTAQSFKKNSVLFLSGLFHDYGKLFT